MYTQPCRKIKRSNDSSGAIDMYSWEVDHCESVEDRTLPHMATIFLYQQHKIVLTAANGNRFQSIVYPLHYN